MAALSPRLWLTRWPCLTRARRYSGNSSHILRSRFSDVPLLRIPYHKFLWMNSDKYADRIALVDGLHPEHALTYRQAAAMSHQFGRSLQHLGATKGDVLAILMPNLIDYPVVFSGCSSVGVTVTTVSTMYTSVEISRQLQLSNAKWAVTTELLLPLLEEAIRLLEQQGGSNAKALKNNILLSGDAGHASVRQLATRPGGTGAQVDVAFDVTRDILALPFSSGTTGLPKAVMLSHFNMVANACQMTMCPDEMAIVKQSEQQPVTLGILPLFHIYALNVSMTTILWAGGKLVCLPQFDPATFVAALERFQPTYLHLAPPLMSFCASSPDVTQHHFTSVQHVVCGAAPLGQVLTHKFKTKFPRVDIREGWGMSELSPLGTISPIHGHSPGSCGQLACNTEAKIIGADCQQPVGPDQVGELCIRGPQVMVGYLNNNQATSDTIKDGWLHSGDLAYYDRQGNIFIADRIKELIKVKGLQVAPAELEDLIRRMPGVADVAVIGVPHERHGEAPRAYVVLQPDSDLTADRIVSFVGEHVAQFKQLLGGVQFVKSIPKAASGKILRRILASQFQKKQDAQV